MDVAKLISALGDHGFADIGTTVKVREIQNAIWNIEAAAPWPFLEVALDLNFDGTSPIPSNAPTVWRASLRAKDLVTGTRIQFIRLDDFEDGVGIDYAQAGDPSCYYFEGNQLKFWPVPPASTGRIKWRYLQISPEITDTSTEASILIPKQYHELIAVKTLVNLYRMEDDLELAAYFDGAAGPLFQTMKDNQFMQQFDQPDFIRVLDWDDYDQ